MNIPGSVFQQKWLKYSPELPIIIAKTGVYLFTQDDSSYFRGLLTLAAIDESINEWEKDFIISIGKKLGFEREFCTESLNGIRYNKYVDRSVPVFSDATLSQNFLQDCYKLATIDKKLDLKEIEWLNSVAAKNNIQPLVVTKDN